MSIPLFRITESFIRKMHNGDRGAAFNSMLQDKHSYMRAVIAYEIREKILVQLRKDPLWHAINRSFDKIQTGIMNAVKGLFDIGI
jgi:hypothetical protein